MQTFISLFARKLRRDNGIELKKGRIEFIGKIEVVSGGYFSKSHDF